LQQQQQRQQRAAKQVQEEKIRMQNHVRSQRRRDKQKRVDVGTAEPEVAVPSLQYSVERLHGADFQRHRIEIAPHGTIMVMIDRTPQQALAVMRSDWYVATWRACGNVPGGYYTTLAVAFSACGLHEQALHAVRQSYGQPDRKQGPQAAFRRALSKETEAWVTLKNGRHRPQLEAIRLYREAFLALCSVHESVQNSGLTEAVAFVPRPISLNAACERVRRQLNEGLKAACTGQAAWDLLLEAQSWSDCLDHDTLKTIDEHVTYYFDDSGIGP
jgi:hypothetical protein